MGGEESCVRIGPAPLIPSVVLGLLSGLKIGSTGNAGIRRDTPNFRANREIRIWNQAILRKMRIVHTARGIPSRRLGKPRAGSEK